MTAEADFVPYQGDMMGLHVDENHMVFRCNCCPGKILFSVSRRGNAASCHFASDKAGLRHIKEAMNRFFGFLMWLFDWCRMVLAPIKRSSVCRVVRKAGFVPLGKSGDIHIYMRCR